MPIMFVGHGSPMNTLADNDFTQSMRRVAKTLPKPKAILAISAHWETRGTWVTGMNKPKTIHDFFGFPQALFDFQYPALGNSTLANIISNTILDPKVEVDSKQWGIDHGTWSVLAHLFPDAKIPVVQLSIDSKKPLSYHFELGQKLKFLREQGVLILGSGNIVHNLSLINWNTNAKPFNWNLEFDEWVKNKLTDRDFNSLKNDPIKSQAGKLSIPTLEHYIPLLYVIGASHDNESLVFDYEGYQNASMSMRSFRFF